MSPDTSTPAAATTESVVANATVPHALQAGLELVLKAEDGGDWKAVAEWLARNPACATDLAEFLAAQRGIKPLIAPLRLPRAVSGTVGGLELREVIGKGAMGVVHRAYDPALKCDRAVKLLHTTGDLTSDELAHFRFEAEAVASLGHTNEHIVPVLSSGEVDGVPYLVMPLMKESLAGWLKGLGEKRKLPPKKAAEIARDIALGVHHAHQRGLIHRDLKPGNILLDDQGRPRVADFGLARRVDATATKVAGTPSYMAPEQTSSGKGLTTAVDVHAVGVILFELLAGGPPFGGSDVGSILRKVAEEPVPGVRQYRTDVPRDLETICAKCLQKRPEDRYPSAAALAEDLERFLNGEPISGQKGPGVLSELARAFGYKRELPSLGSWPVAFMGTFNTGVSLATIQVALLLDAPRWVSWSALAFYHVTWVLLVCLYVIVRRNSLNPFERMSGVFHLAMMLAAAACLPTQLWLHHGDVAPVFPPMLAVIGVIMFAQGATFWGRMYLIGGLMLVVVALMPLLPVVVWPGVYGVIMTLLQFWLGLYLRRFHHEGKANAATPSP
jgi:eukaryotic-like serine/threonine-protein kinase